MSVTTMVQSYGQLYGASAAQPRRASVAAEAVADTPASSTVSISAAAREAAKNETASSSGIKLPGSIMQWFNKDFPADVIDEARARLADIQANGELGASGPMNLPLLPENQVLQDSFRQERKELAANGYTNMSEEQSARFNLLLNLDLRLQQTGWKSPMTEADVQREFDISNAMAKLANEDPSLRPPPMADDTSAGDAADLQSGAITSAWRERWEEAGLVMPTAVTITPGHDMWTALGEAAGIGENELLTQLRSLANNLQGSALTRGLENFISERYVAMKAEQEKVPA